MATTNIDVNKQTVVDLLKSGKANPFVIPEYQRPYAWSDDEIITLFDDLWEFSIERTKKEGPKTYFLGSIVSFENDNEEKEIIDGQQRITSLFLLLRAVYAKLEEEENKTDEVKNFIAKIQPALWQEDELTGKVDKSKILLRSEVATDHGNEILRKILETGVTASGANDNYSKNYNKFLKLYSEKAEHNPLQIFQFINALLNYSILLPISADSQDTALTIFSTLNNRGLPLSDADIFKSVLYKQLAPERKRVFAKEWKELEVDATKYGESIQSLFYYQMFQMRAEAEDENSTLPGIRKYYMEKGKDRLQVNIIDKLAASLKLWKVINGGETIEDEPWSCDTDILKALDILTSYTNEYWKYPVQIYYNTHKRLDNFAELFRKFLRKLCVMLVTRYLETPTVNAIKVDILKLDVQIIKTPEPEFFAGFKTEIPADVPNPYFVTPHRNMIRMLLKFLAYNNAEQTDLLPGKWEIEHIFPQKWDTSFFDFDEEDANSRLEHLGNKLPLEKPMNIRASNNYFEKKKEQYAKSQIAIAKAIGYCGQASWTLSDIDARDAKISDELTSLMKKWTDEYLSATDDSKGPAEENAHIINCLTPEALSKLSPELLEQLKQAAGMKSE